MVQSAGGTLSMKTSLDKRQGTSFSLPLEEPEDWKVLHFRVKAVD